MQQHPYYLDDNEFDVILIGTSLSNSLLAAGLAHAGKKVCHVDTQDVYGGNTLGLHMKELKTFLETIPSSTEAICTTTDELDNSAFAYALDGQDGLDVLWSYKDNVEPDATDKDTTTNNNTDAYKTPGYRNICAPGNAQFSGGSFYVPAVEEGEECLYTKMLEQKKDRYFCIDTNPHLLFSKDKIIQLLVRSDACKYLTFRAIDDCFVGNGNNSIQKIPLQRSDIFKTDLLSESEKFNYAKFMQLFIKTRTDDNKENDIDEIMNDKEEKLKLTDLFNSHKLSKPVQNFIMYSIVMVENKKESETIKATDGINRIKQFLLHLGRFTPGAFIAPLYGTNGLPQAFNRFASLRKVIYMLNFKPQAVLSKDNKIHGIISQAKQILTCKHMIMDPDYLSNQHIIKQKEQVINNILYARGIAICSKPLSNSESGISGSMLTIPPSDLCPYSVRIIQMGSSLDVCPKDYYIYYLCCETDGDREISAEKILLPVVQYLTTSALNDNKLICAGFYHQVHRSLTNNIVNNNLKDSNIIVMADTEVFSLNGFEKSCENAEEIFKHICPDEDFLPKLNDEGLVDTSKELKGKARREERYMADFSVLDELDDDLDALLDEVDGEDDIPPVDNEVVEKKEEVSKENEE